MGLFGGLLRAPLAPVRGVVWLAQMVGEQAERELADPARMRAELEQIEADHARGAITDTERDERAAAVIGRRMSVREVPGDGR